MYRCTKDVRMERYVISQKILCKKIVWVSLGRAVFRNLGPGAKYKMRPSNILKVYI